VDEAMPGDEILAPTRRRLRVRCRAWGHRECGWPAALEIVRHGEVIRKTVAGQVPGDALSVEFEIDSADGFWLAARATGADGSLAHTTPVYVIRPPLRFWKHEAVNDLLAQRLANLDDVERLIARARESVEQGQADDNRTAGTMARQAPEILKRVSEARAFFDHLKQVARDEQSRRHPRN
jgi:hypothetical protein